MWFHVCITMDSLKYCRVSNAPYGRSYLQGSNLFFFLWRPRRDNFHEIEGQYHVRPSPDIFSTCGEWFIKFKGGRGTYGTELALVVRVGRLQGRRAVLRGWHAFAGTNVSLACVALGNNHSAPSRWHRPSLCVAGVALGDIHAAICVAGVALAKTGLTWPCLDMCFFRGTPGLRSQF